MTRLLPHLLPVFLAITIAGLAVAGEQPTVAPEPGEESPGGGATMRQSIDTPDAFSHPSHGLAPDDELRFKVGNAIFRKQWASAPASTHGSDGLGPLFNARSCQSCHVRNGRGHPPAPGDQADTMFLRLSVPPQTEEQRRHVAEHRVNTIDEPTYGTQLQNLAIQGLDNEGRMHVDYTEEPVRLGDGTMVSLRRPTYRIDGLKYGPMHPQTMQSPRVGPPVIGLGLLEAIPESDIRANADPDDKDRNGISGRANEVWSSEQGKVTLGRFGWKAGKPSVREQSASALTTDIGLSNPLDKRASGDCTAAQPRCLAAPNGNTDRDGGLEVGPKVFDHLAFYAENIAVPPRRNLDAPAVRQGKAIFHVLNCQGCHKPSFMTGTVPGQPQLSRQKIWPYADLLLHDMGEGLADHRPEGVADGGEWRTPPLWGIGLTRLVSGHTQLLHDGRARNIEEAILWHGGEAQAARDAYAALPKTDRDALIKFVESL